MWHGLVMAILACGCGRVDFTPSARGDADAASQLDGSNGTQASIMTGCALHLPMDEASWVGEGAVIDTCSGFRGTAGGNASSATDPVRGTVGNFVGGTSCVTIPDDPVLRGATQMTISAWIRPAQLSPNSFGVVAKRTDFTVNSEYAAFIWADSDGAGTANQLYFDIDTQRAPDDLMVYPNNAWHQFTVVYDGGTQSALTYVDGAPSKTLQEPASITPPAVEPDLAIGCLPLNGPAQAFVGQLDEVVIWNRALTAADVATWYSQTVK
ncbi:MAG: LamG domain-containing protein [Kofleriaceae bacterium]